LARFKTLEWKVFENLVKTENSKKVLGTKLDDFGKGFSTRCPTLKATLYQTTIFRNSELANGDIFKFQNRA
jgi:hypothetical protein